MSLQLPKMNNRTPKWFKDWRNNEFYHLAERVSLNTKLLWAIIAGIIALFLAGKYLGS